MTSANLLSLPTLATISTGPARSYVSSRDVRYHDPADARSCHLTACSELLSHPVPQRSAALNPPVVLPEFAASSASVFQTPAAQSGPSAVHPRALSDADVKREVCVIKIVPRFEVFTLLLPYEPVASKGPLWITRPCC